MRLSAEREGGANGGVLQLEGTGVGYSAHVCQGPVSHLNGHQVLTFCLKQATVGCFEDSRLGVEQLGLQVSWNSIECLLLDATDISSCVVQPHKSST